MPERWFAVARRAYIRAFPKSVMSSTESRVRRWVDRYILRRKPRLHHFEIHITDHCNLNCRGCAHFSNIARPWFADPDVFESEMRAVARLFRAVDQIYLLGGEPLLHPDLPRFLYSARKAFPKDAFPDLKMYLMTNGVLVTRMSELAWRALAETGIVLLCDNYPIGLPVDEINELGRKHGAVVEWTVFREEFFRLPVDLDLRHDPVESFWHCQGYNNCPIVRNGRLYPCAYVAFSDVLEERFGLQGLRDEGQSSSDIMSASDGWKIMDFLLRPVPWCAHCDSGRLSFVPWGRSSRSLEEWVNAGPSSTPPASDDGTAEGMV